MTSLYLTENTDLKNKLNGVLSRHTAAPIEILRTENGKPYLKGNDVYFSVTHSKNRAAFAVSGRPIGVDLETLTGRTHTAARGVFSAREREELADERAFLAHWTVREAYVKMLGGTLATYLKRLEYFGGELLVDGNKSGISPILLHYSYGVVCVCGGEGGLKIYEV